MKDVHLELSEDDGCVTVALAVPCTARNHCGRLFPILTGADGEIPASMRTCDPEVVAYPGRIDVHLLRIGPGPKIVGKSIWRWTGEVLNASAVEALAAEGTRYEARRALQALGILPGWPPGVAMKVADALAAIRGVPLAEAEDMLEVEVLHRIRPLLGRETLELAAAAERRWRYVGPPVEPSTVH